MIDVAMLAPPDDGDDGIGTYTGDLLSAFGADVDSTHVSFPPGTETNNPLPLLRAALQAGMSDSEIVHVQHEYALFGPISVFSWPFFGVLFLLAKLRGFRLVVTLHSAWNNETVAGESLERLKRLYIQANNRLIVLVADRLLFLSKNCQDAFCKSVVPDGFEVVPHGVKTPNRNELSAEDAKAAFDVDPDETLVVEPGYVREQKGTHIFVAVADRLPDVEFLVAGGIQDEQSEPYLRKLQRQAAENVSFTGHLEEGRFHAAFRAADLVCLPYLQMTQSGVFNWCAAYEVPVAAADHAYFRRLADEWGCVACFDPADIEDVAQTVSALLESPARRETLVANLAEYREVNSFANVAETHTEVYGKLIT